MPPDVAAGLTFAGLGLFVGFFSGLLGIGGGAMTVPILGLVFVASGFEPAHVMPMAIGSSLAAIVPATASGTRTHHHHGAVRWDLVRGLAPGIVLAGLAAGTV
ncbi:MAG TPA: sulfite exporter TauE/SafE family protein, partial [Usitatibacteraceae bacterium]|nr:sulfite exporter TauE/SafE family protein [Usitatibacteraceae bacterium]